MGDLLRQGWLLKKTMAEGISNSKIDEVYDKAIKAGADGGKLLGAGGAGFLLLYCRPELQAEVRKALNLKELIFDFDTEGSKIIYEDKNG
jgi:D-glycero-alpha-D-manno-heptose-7-phosphate kinase